jgi:hypothetical protein
MPNLPAPVPAHPSRLAVPALLLTALATILGACDGADREQHRDSTTVDPARVAAERHASVQDSAGAPCRVANLALSRVGADAGAGSRGVTYALTNAGPRPCTLVGHPAVVLLDAAGRPLPGLRQDEAPAPDGGAAGPVTLAPDDQATFAIRFTGIDAGTLRCADAAAVRVTPPGAEPGASPELRMPAELHVCGEVVHVTPLVPATAALIGRYRAESDGGTRLVGLRLAAGDSAVVETRPPGGGAPVRLHASWRVRDSVVVVRLADVRPFSWIVGGGYLRPLAWDTAAYGARGTAMVRAAGDDPS